MPIVTSRNDVGRPTQTANTDTQPWNRPRETVTVSTKPPETFVEKAAKIAQPSMSEETPAKETSSSTPAPVPQAKEVTLSPKLAALARKEAKFRQQEQAFKAKQAKFEAEQAEAAKLLKIKERLAAKDYAALEELGVSYQDWSNALLSQAEDEKPETQAIKKLEEKLTSLEESQKAQVSKQYEATINQYKAEIKRATETNPDFATIKELKAQEHVLQHILDTFEQDGEILTVEQASKEIEDFLIEDALAMTKLSKVKAKLAPASQPKQKQVLPPPQSGQQSKTLTNRVATAAPAPVEPKFAGKQMQHLSPRERLALAIQKASRQQ